MPWEDNGVTERLFVKLVARNPASMHFLRDIIREAFVSITFRYRGSLRPCIGYLAIRGIQLDFGRCMRGTSHQKVRRVNVSVLYIRASTSDGSAGETCTRGVGPTGRFLSSGGKRVYGDLVPVISIEVMRT